MYGFVYARIALNSKGTTSKESGKVCFRDLVARAAFTTVALVMVVQGSAFATDPPVEVVRFQPDQTVWPDHFGLAVAISGGLAVAGAPNDIDGSPSRGSLSYFAERYDGTSGWGLALKHQNSGSSQRGLGSALDVERSTLVSGTRGASSPGMVSGTAQVFELAVAGQTPSVVVTDLISSDIDVGDAFGAAVAISGDVIVIGAPDKDLGVYGTNLTGAAYVFERDHGGPGAWGQVAKLLAPDPIYQAYFGGSVAVDGDTVIVGAVRADTDGYRWGAVYVYERSGGPTAWNFSQKLLSDHIHDSSDQFSYRVDIDGDTIVATAPMHNLPGGPFREGSAYVFQRDPHTTQWHEIAELAAPIPSVYGVYGKSAAVDGNAIAIGDLAAEVNGVRSGVVYLYGRHQGGLGQWGHQSTLIAADQLDGAFGSSLALSRGRLVVGDFTALQAGVAHVFVAAEADLAVTVSESRDPAWPGSPPGKSLVYRVEVRHLGGEPATGVAVEVTTEFPPGVGIDWIRASPPTTYADGRWDIGNLSKEEEHTLLLALAIDEIATPGTDVIGLAATITEADQFLVKIGNDQATQYTSIGSRLRRPGGRR